MSTIARVASSSAEPRGFRRFWRALKQLFHEAVGAIFAVLAIAWLNSAFRAWTRDVAHWLIVVALAVGLIFVAFSVTSFRRARQL
jgi:multisubunit Na+/H+ antiporter MnhB subunit